jgi:hypothetical protein
LAKLNDFPTRGIKPDSGADMAWREKYRMKMEKEIEQQKNKKKMKAAGKKLLSNDSARLLKELARQKKRGEDCDETLLAQQLKEHKDKAEKESEVDENGVSVLPEWVKFPKSKDEFYPAEYEGTIFDCYNLRVVFDREKTGFEETKDLPIVLNSIIAGRY